MLSILAMAWSWYSEVMDSMHPTRIRQVVKNPRATHITVHWDFLPILFWLETDFLGSPVGIEQAGCNWGGMITSLDLLERLPFQEDECLDEVDLRCLKCCQYWQFFPESPKLAGKLEGPRVRVRSHGLTLTEIDVRPGKVCQPIQLLPSYSSWENWILLAAAAG